MSYIFLFTPSVLTLQGSSAEFPTYSKVNPDLIVGFNTFLPPGFKIEVHGTNEINISGPTQHTHTLQQIAISEAKQGVNNY